MLRFLYVILNSEYIASCQWQHDEALVNYLLTFT